MRLWHRGAGRLLACRPATSHSSWLFRATHMTEQHTGTEGLHKCKGKLKTYMLPAAHCLSCSESCAAPNLTKMQHISGFSLQSGVFLSSFLFAVPSHCTQQAVKSARSPQCHRMRPNQSSWVCDFRATVFWQTTGLLLFSVASPFRWMDQNYVGLTFMETKLLMFT